MSEQANTSSNESAAELLKKLTEQVSDLEDKKITKGELDLFVKNQSRADTSYKAAYPGLKDTWCKQHTLVAELCHDVKCAFPPDKEEWKKLVDTCICPKFCNVTCLTSRIKARKRCGTGKNERARDRAKAKLDAARTQLDELVALEKGVKDALAANANLIKEIRGLLGVPAERAIAPFLFWYRLLPLHRQLQPEDIDEACKKFLSGLEDPSKCGDCKCENEKDPDPCVPPADAPYGNEPQCSWPALPALVHPRKYIATVDAAWFCLRDWRKASAIADDNFKKSPDDLASLEARLKTLTDQGGKKVEDDIKACLKEKTTPGNCCPSAMATPATVPTTETPPETSETTTTTTTTESEE